MKPFTAKEAKDNLYSLIDEVAANHQPIAIKGENNDAVLISREDWEAIAIYTMNTTNLFPNTRSY